MNVEDDVRENVFFFFVKIFIYFSCRSCAHSKLLIYINVTILHFFLEMHITGTSII
jgi:hypothetical protein